MWFSFVVVLVFQTACVTKRLIPPTDNNLSYIPLKKNNIPTDQTLILLYPYTLDTNHSAHFHFVDHLNNDLAIHLHNQGFTVLNEPLHYKQLSYPSKVYASFLVEVALKFEQNQTLVRPITEPFTLFGLNFGAKHIGEVYMQNLGIDVQVKISEPLHHEIMTTTEVLHLQQHAQSKHYDAKQTTLSTINAFDNTQNIVKALHHTLYQKLIQNLTKRINKKVFDSYQIYITKLKQGLL